MPARPGRQCSGKGPRLHRCSSLVRGRDRYCRACAEYDRKEQRQRDRVYDRERDRTRERRFIHSERWRSIRDSKLCQDQLCEMCLSAGREVRAVLVHHIDSDEMHNPADGSNHQSLCNACHETIHKRDRFRREIGK